MVARRTFSVAVPATSFDAAGATGLIALKLALLLAALVVASREKAEALAAQARDLVGSHVAPGITTDELDRIGHEFLCDHGAYPSTLGYRQFPKSLCTSVNEVVCHGIPDMRELQHGEIAVRPADQLHAHRQPVRAEAHRQLRPFATTDRDALVEATVSAACRSGSRGPATARAR